MKVKVEETGAMSAPWINICRKSPKEALEKDSFYVKPLAKRTLDPLKPWFSAVPIGKNKREKLN